MIDKIKSYIEENFCENNESIDENTLLLTTGIIDSVGALKMVDFIENEFDIEFEAHEVDRDNLDSLVLINKFLETKLS